MTYSKKQYDILFLKYYMRFFGASYIKVFHYKNKLPCGVVFYNKNKRKMKHQPPQGNVTLTGMFKPLKDEQIYSCAEALEILERSDC